MAVEEGKNQDMDDGMQCINHPYSKNPGGICAICLQENLQKLVSSSNLRTSQNLHESSSSSPSFRSNSVGSSASGAGNGSLSLSVAINGNNSKSEPHYCSRRNERVPKIPFLLAKKKKSMLTSSSANRTADIVYRRSKSTTADKRSDGEDFIRRTRGGFWSFLHVSSSKHHKNNRPDMIRATQNQIGNGLSKRDEIAAITSQSESGLSKSDKIEARTTQTENGSSSSLSKKEPNGQNCSNVVSSGAEEVKVSSFERKVSRSRSVGCGNRSFSGDFFGMISNGFGDCVLRRVESQREGKPKVSGNNSKHNSAVSSSEMRDMIRCGGIFGGFLIMAPASSSTSSSSTSSSS